MVGGNSYKERLARPAGNAVVGNRGETYTTWAVQINVRQDMTGGGGGHYRHIIIDRFMTSLMNVLGLVWLGGWYELSKRGYVDEHVAMSGKTA